MVNIRLTIEASDPDIAKEIAEACATIIERRSTGTLKVGRRQPEPPRLQVVRDPDTLTAGGASR